MCLLMIHDHHALLMCLAGSGISCEFSHLGMVFWSILEGLAVVDIMFIASKASNKIWAVVIKSKTANELLG